MSTDAISKLRERLGEVMDLRAVAQLLEWDEQTVMPPGGAEARANHMGTLSRIAHERFIADDLGALLEEAAKHVDLDSDDDEASLVRVAQRRYRKERQVAADLKAEIAYSASEGQHIW